MNIADIALTRYTTKAFDATRRIPDDQVSHIETLLRYCPSSTNAQPWHFFIASTDEGKARIAKGTQGFYAFNEPKVKNASHVVVFCTRVNIDDAYLQMLLEQETRDGRLATPEARAKQHGVRSFFVNSHRFEMRDVQHWLEKQVYLAVGALLVGAGALGIDACPIEGFDQKALDEALDLRSKELTSSVIVALGYRANDDFNAQLPKSRLPAAQVITRL
jgi:nitroreductase/dihydropteridine reductase